MTSIDSTDKRRKIERDTIILITARLVATLNKGPKLTDKEIEAPLIDAYGDADGDADEVMFWFEDKCWTDELEKTYGEICNNGDGWYLSKS